MVLLPTLQLLTACLDDSFLGWLKGYGTFLLSGKASEGLLERSWGDFHLMAIHSSIAAGRGPAAPPCHPSCRGSWDDWVTSSCEAASMSLLFLCLQTGRVLASSHLTEAHGHRPFHPQQVASWCTVPWPAASAVPCVLEGMYHIL